MGTRRHIKTLKVGIFSFYRWSYTRGLAWKNAVLLLEMWSSTPRGPAGWDDVKGNSYIYHKNTIWSQGNRLKSPQHRRLRRYFRRRCFSKNCSGQKAVSHFLIFELVCFQPCRQISQWPWDEAPDRALRSLTCSHWGLTVLEKTKHTTR